MPLEQWKVFDRGLKVFHISAEPRHRFYPTFHDEVMRGTE